MEPETIDRGITRDSASRVSRHRIRAAARGIARLEVSVPRADASLVRLVARMLRKGGNEAAKLRRTLADLAPPPVARTGAELVAFLRASPLSEIDLLIERDRSPGRPSVEFE